MSPAYDAASGVGRIIGRRHDRTSRQTSRTSNSKTLLPTGRRPDMTVHKTFGCYFFGIRTGRSLRQSWAPAFAGVTEGGRGFRCESPSVRTVTVWV